MATLAAVLAPAATRDAAERLSIDVNIPPEADPGIGEIESNWFFYDHDRWGRWEAMDAPFPIDGRVKREYDYAGADSAMRVEYEITRFTQSGGGTEARDRIVWTGAAK
ncbi:MAG TPA: hypothetical protein PLZ36_07430, partial [Armatimonadota bacterium]|nr:hypothetical protein [Armatimonadota bacterium]